MAIDPTISMGITPVTAADPIEQQQRAVQLRSLLQQQQQQQLLQPLQLQEAQINLQNAQMQQDVINKNAAAAKRQQQDQEYMNQAQNSDDSYDTSENGVKKFNYDKFESVYAKLGGSHQGIIDARTQWTKMAVELAKQKAEDVATWTANQETLRNMFSGLPDNDDAAREAMIQKAQDIGVLTTPEATAILQEANTPENRQKRVKMHSTAAENAAAAVQLQADAEKSAQLRSSRLANIEKAKNLGVPLTTEESAMVPESGLPMLSQQDWTNAVNKLAPATGETADINRMGVEGITQAFKETGDKQKAAKAVYDKVWGALEGIAKEKAAVPGKIEMAKLLSEAKNQYPGDYTKSGDEFLSSLEPAHRAMVKLIGDYMEPPLQGFAAGRPEGQALMGAVSQYNQSYDSTKFDARKTARIGFTNPNGATGKQVNSINTAILHSSQLLDVSQALENGSFVPGNALYNWWITQFGDPGPNAFNVVKDRLAGELTRSLVGVGAGSAGERSENAKEFANASSPQMLSKAVRSAVGLLGSKLGVYREQWTQAMGEKDKTWDPLLPSAKGVLSNLGFNPEHPQLSGVAGKGASYTGPVTRVEYPGYPHGRPFKGTPAQAEAKGLKVIK